MTNRERPGAETSVQPRGERDDKISGVRPVVRSSQRVLLVDSCSDAMAFMAFALRRHGHAVVMANCIESALKASRASAHTSW